MAVSPTQGSKGEFAERLDLACARNGECPPLNKGRLTWVKRRFHEETGRSLSVEAIRKWFSGDAWPRRDSVLILAKVLNVDSVWLETGHQRTREISTDNEVRHSATLAIDIRPGVRVEFKGLPSDLTGCEAQRLANLVLALATT